MKVYFLFFVSFPQTRETGSGMAAETYSRAHEKPEDGTLRTPTLCVVESALGVKVREHLYVWYVATHHKQHLFINMVLVLYVCMYYYYVL